MESQFLQSLCDSDALAIGGWRSDGRITAANKALVALIGYSQAEIESGTVGWEDITPPEYAPLDAQALEEIRSVGSCTPFQKEYFRRDGSRVPVLVGGAAFGDGIYDAGTFYAVDLSQRKLATPIPPEIQNLTDRQRVIALVISRGHSNKRVAALLGVGLRTAELERYRIAKSLKVATSDVVIWSVENRKLLLSSIKDHSAIPAAAASIVGLP